jgi:transcriptional regulator with XRE-family HTH domain
MAQKTIQGNENLAKQIKLRRNELGITIEEAALRAGIGTKTWCRYEAGQSIRIDKCRGICKALNWNSLPEQNATNDEHMSIQEYKNHEAWSKYLENNFGDIAAMSFAVGSDILLDQINDYMNELSSMPVGTHIGQVDVYWLNDSLPKQFLMQYNYEFMYRMKCTIYQMRKRAKDGSTMTAFSVIEELIYYICCKKASTLIELVTDVHNSGNFDDWIFDLFDDSDIESLLYSDMYLDESCNYHFSKWFEQQFYQN